MKRILHALSTLAVLVTAGPALAQDYRCQNAAGCTASKSENGTVTQVNFRKGDLVSTEDGWSVDPEEGWQKVRTSKTRRTNT